MAQAAVGQTDWFDVPENFSYVQVFFNLTANAGTTPISTLSLLQANLALRDDGTSVAVLTGAAITAASFHSYTLGPNLVTAGADSATASASVVQNGPLPKLFGIKILNDRGTADETYSYTLEVSFRR